MQYFILLTNVHKRRKRDIVGESWGRGLSGSLPYAHSARVARIYAQSAGPSFMLLQKLLNLANNANSSP